MTRELSVAGVELLVEEVGGRATAGVERRWGKDRIT
jgi:hypothetical protein